MVRGEPGGNANFGHAYSLNGPMAVQDGVRAGCDSNCGDPYRVSGMAAIQAGLVAERELNASIRRLLRPHFQLGLFDPPAGQPFTGYTWDDVDTPEHRQLALEAARQSIVLLQNPAAVLPLKKGTKVLVAGPMYDATRALLGNYNGAANSSLMPPMWKQFASMNGVNFTTQSGGVSDPCNNDTAGIAAVVAAAQSVDVVVLALGGACHEGEGTDRDFLQLPGAQEQLFDAVLKLSPRIKVVVVIINGGPISIDTIKPSPAAVVQAGFPGQSGAIAIAEVLWGEVNPGGKLTTTIYPAAYAHGEPLGGMPWMDAQVRPHNGTEGRTCECFLICLPQSLKPFPPKKTRPLNFEPLFD